MVQLRRGAQRPNVRMLRPHKIEAVFSFHSPDDLLRLVEIFLSRSPPKLGEGDAVRSALACNRRLGNGSDSMRGGGIVLGRAVSVR